MDYLVMAWKAFELRQFLEAENYLIKHEGDSKEISLDFFKLKYQIYSEINSDKKIESLKSYLEILNKDKKYPETILLCEEEIKKELTKKSFLYSYYCEALYELGNQSKAASVAREHIEYLLNKKIYHELELALNKYQRYFKNYIFFKIMSLQVSIVLENLIEAEKKWNEIVETLERKFSKIEDIKNVSKDEILLRCHEMILQSQLNSIESVLLSHKSHLKIKNNKTEVMSGSDWKKLVELVVFERSFYNLKLCMNLALEIDEEIFNEASRLMKRKKGYSLIKLTRFDKKLKEKLISKKEKTEETELFALSESDLVIEDKQALERTKIDIILDKDEESLHVERSLIRSLAFLDFNEASVIDLITTFIQLEFYQVANFLIKTAVNEIKLQKETVRKVSYLKATISMKTGEYFLALSEISELLSNPQIDLNEYTELRYMEGVLLEMVGDIKNAFKSFSEVISVDPNYRRVKERMQKIA